MEISPEQVIELRRRFKQRFPDYDKIIARFTKEILSTSTIRNAEPKFTVDEAQQLLEEVSDQLGLIGNPLEVYQDEDTGMKAITGAGFKTTIAGSLIDKGIGNPIASIASRVENAMAIDPIANRAMQYLQPKMQATSIAPINNSLPTYAIGGYAIDLVANLPTPEDIIQYDTNITQNGETVSHYEVPVLRSDKQFQYIKTNDAVVKSGIRLAAIQMQGLLNSGTRFWNSDGAISPADINTNKTLDKVS